MLTMKVGRSFFHACLLNSLIYEFCFHFQFLIEHHFFMHGLEDDFAHEKLAAEYICRELREADETNLLQEEGCLIFFFLLGESAFF